MKKISPFLWFDTRAEEAADFYVSVFDNSRIVSTTHYLEGGPLSAGTVLTVEFVLDGEEFTALNGGLVFAFNPAVSFVVDCATQNEVDRLWQALSAGGEPGQCGWLT
jgi:predicted 3-demethylubiquinone-9 3-methyltransferase (glyoxalase superfamily)